MKFLISKKAVLISLSLLFILSEYCLCEAINSKDGSIIFDGANFQQYGFQYFVVTNQENGAIIAWEAYSSSVGNCIFCQKVRGDSIAEWEPNGIKLSQGGMYGLDYLVSDNQGGAVLLTSDAVFSIEAVRVSSTGLVNQMQSAITFDGYIHVDNVQAVADGPAGGIVVWHNSNGNLMLQKYSSNRTLWTYGGTTLCAGFSPNIAADGSGGAVVAWERYSPANGIFAQRINGDGDFLWGASGVEISNTYNPSTSRNLIKNFKGDFFVIWIENSTEIYAQKINSAGLVLWGCTGKKVGMIDANGETAVLECLPCSGGGTFIVWQDHRNGNWDIYAQRLSDDGQLLWGNSGKSVCDALGDQQKMKIAQDNNGGMIVAWQDYRNANWDIYARRVDRDGKSLWATDSAVCTATGFQTDVQMIANDSGSAILIWKDRRDSRNDLYVQILDGQGNAMLPLETMPTITPTSVASITPFVAIAEGSVTPNPFLPARGQKAFFNFRLESSTAAYTIHIYNLRGQLQRVLNDTREWDGRSESGHMCEGGVYVYQIESGGRRVSGKVVLIK